MTNSWGTDPLPFLRSAREQLVDFRQLETAMAALPPDVTAAPAAPAATFDEAMSPGLRVAVDDYRERHPDVELRLLRYTRVVDGQPDLVLDAGEEPPSEDALVHLTCAVSAADTSGLHVVAEVLIAARGTR
jgi:hypothetical protein